MQVLWQATSSRQEAVPSMVKVLQELRKQEPLCSML